MHYRAFAASAVFCAAAIIGLTAFSQNAAAQFNSRPQSGGLLGAILQAGARSHALQSWKALSPPIQECTSRALAMKGTSIERLANQGVGADDNRVSIYVSRCEELTGRELRHDFDCTIVEAGVSVSTKCNEEFSEGDGMRFRAISRDQYILDGLRGERVGVTQLETHDAMIVRVERDEKVRADLEVEQQRRQAIADATAKAQAEIAHKKQAAADSAFRQSFALRDSAIQLSRRACSTKEAGTLSKMFGGGSDHDVLAGLLNTNKAPLDTYRQLIAWLPKSSDRQALMTAFHDRIDYDSKRWGEVISHSGKGDYSWETLKASLATIAVGCLWQQYDQLGVAAARSMSPSAIAIASGQVKPSSDADRASASVLSHIPSSQFLHN